MSKSITLTITEDERAELEALLDDYLAESRKDKDEHEQTMARIERHQAESKRAAEDPARAEEALRLELQLEHEEQQRARNSELFWLQVENNILRVQCGLPPRASHATPKEEK